MPASHVFEENLGSPKDIKEISSIPHLIPAFMSQLRIVSRCSALILNEDRTSAVSSKSSIGVSENLESDNSSIERNISDKWLSFLKFLSAILNGILSFLSS